MKKTISQLLAIPLGLFLISATCSIDPVIVPITAITITPATAVSVAVGATTPLGVTVLPADATHKAVTWSSDTPARASVNASGVVTGLSAGAATIRATANDGSGVTATKTINVTVPTPFVAVTNISGVAATAVTDLPLTLSGTVAPATATNKTITWSLQDAGTTGAVLSGNILTATAVGSVTVRATITNGLTAGTPYIQSFIITVHPFEGSGTSISPFLIDSRAKLVVMRDLVNAGTGSYRTAYYRQTVDIDMNSAPAIANWIPIGTTETNSFQGVYNGNGRVISNLKITYMTSNFLGLFGYVDGTAPEIRNVRLSNVNIGTGSGIVGGIVGSIRNGIVAYCRILGGTIAGFNDAGGIVGILLHNSMVGYSYVSGDVTVTGKENAGGIVGSSSGIVRECYSTAKVFGNIAGGVVGSNSSIGSWTYFCYATGTVTGTGTTGAIVGGVVGQNIGKVENCMALNTSVTAPVSASKIRRVAVHFNSSSTLINNYARQNNMTLPAGYTVDAGLDKEDGANMGSPSWPSQTWYADPANWSVVAWNFFGTWEWHIGQSLPILQGFVGDEQDPMLAF